MDLPYLIRRATRFFPDAPLVSDGRSSLTLAEAVDRGERLANSFDSIGVSPAGKVGILMENRTDYVQADLGIALGRRVRTALNARMLIDDFRYMVEDAGIEALIHSASFSENAAVLAEEFGLVPISVDDEDSPGPKLQDLIDSHSAEPGSVSGHDEDPAWITYTSGTTGQPKGVVLSHRSIREVAYNLLLELGPVRPGEKIVLPQPLSHGAGYFLLPYLISGGGVHVMSRFDAEEALEIGRDPRLKSLKVVPAMMPDLLEAAGGRALDYETLIYGAAPIAPPVLEASLDQFGPVLVQIYGQSEAPVTLTCLHKRDHLGAGEERFSAGRAWRSTQIEIQNPGGEPVPTGEIGEVVVSGTHLMSGYLGKQEATDAVFVDGKVRTRDVARIDEQGFIYLLGRSDEMINSGGFNISPREVEKVIGEIPEIEEVVVVGVEDEHWGNMVSAVIRTSDGVSLDSAKVIDYARPKLGFRSPKLVLEVDEVPKTGNGKVDVKALQTMVTKHKIKEES